MSAHGSTYQDLVNDAAMLLKETSDTPRIDAEILMQHVVQQPLAWLIARGDKQALAEHTTKFFKAVAQRQRGVPVAYIIGSRDFWTLSLSVDENVLIPRPDTETLVEHALELLPEHSPLQLLDLGTGSGAIALAIAKERPQAHVLAVDLFEGALAIAQKNALINKIPNVSFLQSSWFAAIDSQTKFELIASNPPYVEKGDPHLEKGDLRFEPDTALIAKDDGLADLCEVIETAPNYLASTGCLIVEHGFEQADEVAAIYKQTGFTQIQCFNDLNLLPRCTRGIWEPV